ncbi:MAG: hypothetical protein Q9159_001184 [Coniocarpon cinnabarinum]
MPRLLHKKSFQRLRARIWSSPDVTSSSPLQISGPAAVQHAAGTNPFGLPQQAGVDDQLVRERSGALLPVQRDVAEENDEDAGRRLGIEISRGGESGEAEEEVGEPVVESGVATAVKMERVDSGGVKKVDLGRKERPRSRYQPGRPLAAISESQLIDTFEADEDEHEDEDDEDDDEIFLAGPVQRYGITVDPITGLPVANEPANQDLHQAGIHQPTGRHVVGDAPGSKTRSIIDDDPANLQQPQSSRVSVVPDTNVHDDETTVKRRGGLWEDFNMQDYNIEEDPTSEWSHS